jgi:hypothetical protein
MMFTNVSRGEILERTLEIKGEGDITITAAAIIIPISNSVGSTSQRHERGVEMNIHAFQVISLPL